MNAAAGEPNVLKLADCGVVDAPSFPDPLDEDLADDERIVITRRRLVRLALVACETGARFERDGLRHDPVAWMLAPRRLFGGDTAMEACLDLDGCRRAILLHGLALGMDADADELDELLRDDEEAKGADVIPIRPMVPTDAGAAPAVRSGMSARGRTPFFRPDAVFPDEVSVA